MLGRELSFSHSLTLLEKFTCRVGTMDVCSLLTWGDHGLIFVFRKEITIVSNAYHVPGTVTVIRRPLIPTVAVATTG